jgi:hypothetical protein
MKRYLGEVVAVEAVEAGDGVVEAAGAVAGQPQLAVAFGEFGQRGCERLPGLWRY